MAQGKRAKSWTFPSDQQQVKLRAADYLPECSFIPGSTTVTWTSWSIERILPGKILGKQMFSELDIFVSAAS